MKKIALLIFLVFVLGACAPRKIVETVIVEITRIPEVNCTPLS